MKSIFILHIVSVFTRHRVAVRPESEQEERRENQAGANKSGEINKTFPEGGFLFILATSFHPRTNFSC